MPARMLNRDPRGELPDPNGVPSIWNWKPELFGTEADNEEEAESEE